MKIKRLIVVGLWIISSSLVACSAGSHAPEEPLPEQSRNTVNHVNSYTTNFTASGKPYYHLIYVLNSENLLQVENYSLQEFEQNGGQFEVLLEKNAFPIQAPNCKSNLILRMPWVPPGTDLSLKYQLYQAILAVHSAQSDSVSIVLELNPYVQKTEQGLELTQCNIFFRHANSEYVPHTKSLN